MTIVVDVRPEVQAEIARQAAQRGRAVEAHAARLLEEAVGFPLSDGQPVFDAERARAAAVRIRELRQGVTLGGLNLRELIDEGHR